MTKEKFKKMDIREFREKGYLQEVNRRFFHPLGLALEVFVEEDETERLGGIWDFREDPEGIYFDIKNRSKELRKLAIEKFMFVSEQEDNRRKSRENLLGFFVEPINDLPIENENE